MTPVLAVDWSQVFLPQGHLLEVVVRGVVMYTALFILLRVGRREAGSLGIADVLLIVLIADASQNAMAGEYGSIAEGIALVVTLIACDYAVDWIGFRFPRMRPWLRPAPLTLIRDGQLIRANMRKEMVTRDELLAQLREQGIDDPTKVKRCAIEGDGRISVVPYDEGSSASSRSRAHPSASPPSS